MTTKQTGGAPGWRELRAHRIARQRAERQQPRSQAVEEEEEEEERPSPTTRNGKAARSGKRAAAPAGSGTSKPRIGVLRASHIERAFILLIYATVLGLVLVSVIGTFYGSHGANAPITDPGAIWAAMRDSGSVLYWAIGIQGALSITQYGARQMARHDWRWWLLYLAALGISVYFNIQAYYVPLLAYMQPVSIYVLILAFDVFPEFVSIRHD